MKSIRINIATTISELKARLFDNIGKQVTRETYRVLMNDIMDVVDGIGNGARLNIQVAHAFDVWIEEWIDW